MDARLSVRVCAWIHTASVERLSPGFRRFRARPDLAQFDQFEAERFHLGEHSEYR